MVQIEYSQDWKPKEFTEKAGNLGKIAFDLGSSLPWELKTFEIAICILQSVWIKHQV